MTPRLSLGLARPAAALLALAALAAPALLLPAALPTALAAAPTPPGGIPVVVGTLDFGAAEGSEERAASMALLEGFPAAPAIIYVDLAIAPRVDASVPDAPKLDFATLITGPDGPPLPEDKSCALGGSQFYGREIANLSVMTGGIYPHLTLDVESVPPAEAPFNFIACAYAPSLPGMVALRIAGFFVVQENAMPEARQIRLVPYTPPYDQALDALARSHAEP